MPHEWAGAPTDRKIVPLRVADCTPLKVLSTIGYRDLHGVDEATARRRLREAVGLAWPARLSGRFPGGPAAPAEEVPVPEPPADVLPWTGCG
ncbi:hypothetical protein [Frankia sp. QA3]|uniref:hypothetical protein n=1 Tax=Frankia sp. QA3 TaxID=710111 RepID=UPI00055EE8F4|nr:hypothetical protein [Frankia sp. QA3]